MSRRLFAVALAIAAVPDLPAVAQSGGENRLTTDPPAVVTRLSRRTDDDLRKELLGVPETGFNQSALGLIQKSMEEWNRKAVGGKLPTLPSDLGPNQFRAFAAELRRPEQFGLPWRMEPHCTLGKEETEALHVLSVRLRDHLRKSTPPKDVRPDPDELRKLLAADPKAEEWHTPAAIPTLTQMLQAENTPLRLLLVEMLTDIKGKEASHALAARSLFDTSAEVREKAIRALAGRPREEFQETLLHGLRYPWPAAADHAAEAITALDLKPVKEMVGMLKEPPPGQPVKDGKKYAVKELVRVNHLSNCVLCHSTSVNKEDLVRGRMPEPGEDPPPAYYQEARGLFVRANTTYLKQDFSVVQPVTTPGKWAAHQRFDYLARIRPLSAAEVKKFEELEKKGELLKDYPQRESVLFALRQVTKANPGDTYEKWAEELPKLLGAVKGKRD